MAAGELVFPKAGATDVVTNPSLLLRIEDAILDPTLSRQQVSAVPALGEGLLLRAADGTLLAPGPLAALETPRSFGTAQAPPGAHVEIATAPLDLAAGAHYEVLSRLAVCAEQGRAVACLSGEYRVIGEFDTGTGPDRQPPSIASVEVGTSPGACLAAFTIVASDDHAAPDTLRFAIDAEGFLGPDVVLPIPGPTGVEALTPLRIVPIDPSGNRGPAFVVGVPFCSELVPDDIFPPPEADVKPLPTPAPPASPTASCGVVPGSARATGESLFGAWLVLLVSARRALPKTQRRGGDRCSGKR